MRGRRIAFALAALWFGSAAAHSAPETVRITIPTAVGFAVTNVSAATAGGPSTVAFLGLDVADGRVLRISVKAESDFIPPSGSAIPASRVSWTTSGAVNGVGSSGVLSTSAYGQLFQGNLNKKNGHVNVSWSLAAPGTAIRAGVHTLTVRWKLESF